MLLGFFLSRNHEVETFEVKAEREMASMIEMTLLAECASRRMCVQKMLLFKNKNCSSELSTYRAAMHFLFAFFVCC